MPRAIIGDVDFHIAGRIRLRMRELKMTQMRLAKLTGVSYQQIQKRLSGTNRMSGASLWLTACVLAVEPGWFFEGLVVGGTSDAAVGDA